jgi:formate hydrogenlyase subunit 4
VTRVRAALLIQPLLAVALAPLLVGVIARTKAFFAGRRGQPLLQPYHDLRKLLGKGAVYSRTTTWIFRAGPAVSLAAIAAASLLVPLGGAPAPLAFEGDLLLFAYLLGLSRFMTVLAALDTGSSFEGMGASREVLFAALAEPALLLGLAAAARLSGSLSLSGLLAISGGAWLSAGPALAMVAAALLVVFLAENSRIPIDDPNTHLELTMIHEVMVLDHGGPDLAFILYGATLKLWILGALIAGVILPWKPRDAWLAAPVGVAVMLILAVIVGAIESSMARLRIERVPQLLVGASVFSVIALVLVLR